MWVGLRKLFGYYSPLSEAEVAAYEQQHSITLPADYRHFITHVRINRWRHGLNPPLSEAEVVAFEQKHSIVLPADYRHFITHIGNGDVEGYPFYRLGEEFGEPWREGDFVGVLSKPFPHREAWNDQTGAPSDDRWKSDPKEAQRQLNAFEKVYFDSSQVNGAMPVWDEGSGALVWLVVTGEEAGHLWWDDRYCDGGLYPVTSTDGKRATFFSHYVRVLFR